MCSMSNVACKGNIKRKKPTCPNDLPLEPLTKRSHISCKKASLRATPLLQIILQGIHSLYLLQGRDIFLTCWFRGSVFVADYFVRNTLALSIIRFPTAHLASQLAFDITTTDFGTAPRYRTMRMRRLGRSVYLTTSLKIYRHNGFLCLLFL